MKSEFCIKKCEVCGNIVQAMENEGNLTCCGQKMKEIEANSTDASFEKHVPNYERIEDEIYVTVKHPMEKEHFIKWIALIADGRQYRITLYPEQNAECRFPYIPGSILYAYCNKHDLWKNEVK